MTFKIFARLLAIGVLALSLAAPANAAFKTMSFGYVGSPLAQEAVIGFGGTNQLRAVVADSFDDSYVSANQVSFTFYNNVTGNVASNIAEIYFDDGSLLGIANVYNFGGTTFAANPLNPPSLPDGGFIGWNSSTPSFLSGVDSDAIKPKIGVNTSARSVKIVYNLIGGQDYDDVINALMMGLDQTTDIVGALRIGLHVRSIGGLGSDSYVNTADGLDFSTDPVPEPASIAMWLTVAVGGAFVARRKSKKAVC